MPGSDFLQLDASAVPRGQRTDWLTERIRVAIRTGRLSAGAGLPPTRVLAVELGLSRGTVSESYRRLAEEGLLVARTGAGSTVTTDLPESTPTAPRPAHGPAPDAGPADLLDLFSGLPDLTAFPRSAWLRAEKDALSAATAKQLGYAPPEGSAELREALSAWLARSRGVLAPAERILITGGVAGALSLLTQVLRADGADTIAIEEPGAEGSSRLVDYWMPRVVPVPVDTDGIDVRALGTTEAGAVLITPAHQYPTGVVLAPHRRRELIDWAVGTDGLIIEDDYDAEYRYDRRPVRALQPLAPEQVAYTSSLSKTIAPALRLGWLVPPLRWHARLVELRWATDLGSPVLPQLVLARLLDEGTLERHLRTMRTRHRVRRDAAMAAIRRHLPHLEVMGIAAGLHLVLRLPERADDQQIAADARTAGISLQPLSAHYRGPAPPGLILNYAAHGPAVLTAAIETLATVVPREPARVSRSQAQV